jgi:hypothetical protein
VRTRLLLVISSEPEGPVVRHRWRAYARDLEQAGIVLQVADWPKARAGRRAALVRAGGADAVVLSRRLLPRGWAHELRRRARRLAYDLDDAMPYRDSTAGATLSRTRERRFRRLVSAADLVFVGNAYLVGLAHGSKKPPVVLPTVVEVPAGPGAPPPADGARVIGWIGARATLPYLEAHAVELAALVAAGRTVRLRVVADVAPTLPPGIALELVPWSEAGEAEALAGMHIGFAPLPDDPWTRGKCGFKVLQMLGAGRPVVATPVGVQADQVRHGETGFLGRESGELLEGLLGLVDDPDLCARMGAAARDDARARWSRAAWAPRVLAAVEDLLS